MRQRSKWYLIEFLAIIFAAFGLVGKYVVEVDPFFHYHKPNVEKYYYTIDNQRSQNDGISKTFDYNMLITGTSMIENFRTTEAERIWSAENARAIKVPYEGGSYKEINDNLRSALEHNENLHIIIRGLDMSKFMLDKDEMRFDLGEYPTYLYDNNIWNDVKYIFNRNVVFDRVYPMLSEIEGHGITSFDEYSRWMSAFTFGSDSVLQIYEETPGSSAGSPVYLTEQERDLVLGNVRQNITSLAKEYPDVAFYYFFTPYSIAWWGEQVEAGNVYKQIEAERLVIEEALQCDNIKLYSFNNRTDITTDLNHYKDDVHYGEWVNSLMLKWMHDGEYQLTEENYEDYLAEELAFYTSYDYAAMADQEDYENDYYAAALLNEEMYGVTPKDITDELLQGELKSARIVKDQYEGMRGVECIGCLEREPEDESSLSEYLMEDEYIGCKIKTEEIRDYRYLVFYGRKMSGDGQPSVFLYDENNQVVAECTFAGSDLDNEWHQYLINIADLEGNVTIIFNGGYTDRTGSEYTSYVFSDVTMY